ncbi:hypothetical protein PIB30_016547 [Stylosanthes scabra]|uniref:Uncharacterized protein n=1 Tax=Stylosanthes scabra TaxID=79078 RepID=A0ABU6R7M0_9FABA|nr:hypothetical protein [Stylosanthes scabra]
MQGSPKYAPEKKGESRSQKNRNKKVRMLDFPTVTGRRGSKMLGMIRRNKRNLKEDTRRILKDINEIQEDSEIEDFSESEAEDANVKARETFNFLSMLNVATCQDEEAANNYLKKHPDGANNQENINTSTRRRGRKKRT